MDAQNVSKLTDHTGYWLHRLRAEVGGSFERKIAERGVTVPQWNVLIAVYHQPDATMAAVAQHIAVDAAAVTRLCDKLEAAGLLQRVPDEKDARITRLRLTSAGAELTPELAKLADENDREFFSPLPPADQLRLRKALRTLLRARGIQPPDDWVQGR